MRIALQILGASNPISQMQKLMSWRPSRRGENSGVVSARAEPTIGDEVVDDDFVGEVEGGGVAKLARYVVEEDEEEEEELQLVCRERRSKA
jgi:hypothetical protein